MGDSWGSRGCRGLERVYENMAAMLTRSMSARLVRRQAFLAWGAARSARRRGFTLIELLVVMAIVAILLTIAGPRYFDHLDRARENALAQSLAVMRDAIDKHKADTGNYPRDIEELVSRRYLRAVPKDPITDSTETWLIVSPPDATDAGMWDVRSGAPGRAKDGTSYGDW